MIGGRVLDPTAVLDIATGRSIYGRALVDVALQTGIVLAVPAAALMEAWAGSPAAGRPFLVRLRALPVVVLEQLDGESAEAAGLLAAERSRPASGGVAHAVHVARRRGWSIVTGDPEAVLALDPHIGFESLGPSSNNFGDLGRVGRCLQVSRAVPSWSACRAIPLSPRAFGFLARILVLVGQVVVPGSACR